MACGSVAPCVALLVGRWGTAAAGWPATIALLVRTMAANERLHFYLLSESPPPLRLPRNVFYRNETLEQLYERLSAAVGLRLPGGSGALRSELRNTPSSGFLAGRDVSGAKVNDLKPMWGEAFGADLLAGYDWWGYLQDDVLLGDLTAEWAMASAPLLADADVVAPYPAPYNSSGVLMLFRNLPAVNRLWRRSADAQLALTEPRYLVFDEWWGSSKDSMAVVLAREAAAGRIRLRQGGVGWFGQDYNNPANMMTCWWKGRVFTSLRFGTSRGYPCGGGDRQLGSSEWSIFHIGRLKKQRNIAKLKLSYSQLRAIEHSPEFQLSPEGVILPERGGPEAGGRSNLLSADSPISANLSELINYLSRVDLCDDLVEHPRIAYALGLPAADGRSWCWRQRFRRQGHCKTSLAVQTLCLRGCGLCPSTRFGVHEALTEEMELGLRLRNVAIEQLPAPTLRARLERAWRVLIGRTQSSAEGADLKDDWEWWHAHGKHYPRGKLHDELHQLIARSPIFTEL